MCLQWREASYTTAPGDVYRVYMVCNVAVTAVDNWLRTPYIERRDANRLYVDVKFTMRRCTNHPNPNRLQQCKESIKVTLRRLLFLFSSFRHWQAKNLCGHLLPGNLIPGFLPFPPSKTAIPDICPVRLG